jgi:Fe-S cluster biogenesis protein NfuA/nitrite reductase/ring-hydroxylating ferredoxin subunit
MLQDQREHQLRAERIEMLLQEVTELPDTRVRATVEELVQALLDMYGEVLSRVLELTAQSQASGNELINIFTKDDLLSSLFLLHELHPEDIETRVARALVEVRPYLKSHGGNVELVKIDKGVAYLRLEGSCHGCPSSTITLKLAIEEAIYKAAPDLDEIHVEGVTDPPPRPGIPITFVPPSRHKNATQTTKQNGTWTIVGDLNSLLEGTLKVIAVEGEPLLFCQIAGTYYAYRDHCGSCLAPLDGSKIEGTALICSSCGQHFDICRAGRSVDTPNVFMEPIPLLVENDKVKVALTKEVQASAAIPTP